MFSSIHGGITKVSSNSHLSLSQIPKLKAHSVILRGVKSGVSNWIGRPDVFPDGNAYLRNATGWPIMGHNRYWAIDNVYATQNGGQYDFIVEKKSDNKKYKVLP